MVGINVAFGFVARGIAWEAHLGGLGVGAAIAGVYLVTRRPEQKTRQLLSVAGIVAGIALILVACVLSSPAYYV